MKGKLRIGISSCLLGKKVRYDGGHRLDSYLKNTLGKSVKWVAVCPEVDCGLPVPREEMRLVGTSESARLITRNSKIDHTGMLLGWIKKRLKEMEKEGLSGFIFKGNSPSCGLRNVKIYNKAGTPVKKGSGIFAREFVKYFKPMPVEDETRLSSAKIKKKFIEMALSLKDSRIL